MDEISRAKIRDNRDFLCENTSLLRDVIRYLNNNYNMFSEKEEYDILNGSDDPEEQLGDFYDLILRKGKLAYGRLIEALRETQNNSVLQRLEGNSLQTTHQANSLESSNSTESPGPITDKTFQKIMRKSLVQSSNKAANLLQLLNALHGEEIISKHEMNVVRSKPTEFEQNSELFGFILPKKGGEIFPALLECLRESENNYIENLFLNLHKELGP